MSLIISPLLLFVFGMVLGVAYRKRWVELQLSRVLLVLIATAMIAANALLFYDLLEWPVNFDGNSVSGSVWVFHTDYTGIYKNADPPLDPSRNIWLVIPEAIFFLLIGLFLLWALIGYKLGKWLLKPKLEGIEQPHIVIVGAGFAGLSAINSLADFPAKVTVIEKNNYHTFLPLLYQVGAAELAPEQIIFPVRAILQKYPNMHFLMGTVNEINPVNRTVSITEDIKVSYEYLIIAMGSKSHFFNVPGAEDYAFPLKTVEEGVELRNHILRRFELAEREPDEKRRSRLLTFVIVGGGPTGVEYAGALSELVYGPLVKDYAKLDFDEVRIILLELQSRLLPTLPEKMGRYALKRLTEMRVEVYLGKIVSEVSPTTVLLKDGKTIQAETTIWTGGAKGDPQLREWGLPTVRSGQIKVLPTLQIADYPNVYVAGDLCFLSQNNEPLPMVAPVALQEGKTAAFNIMRQIDQVPQKPFNYRDKGALATIGRNAAVARTWKIVFTGAFAWILWLIVHIYYLIGFRNRITVLLSWSWDYFFLDRVQRFILLSECN